MATTPRKPPAHLLLALLAPLSILALLILGAFLEPAGAGSGTHTQLGLPPCLSMEVLGVPCPGCGVTTSAALAARGELSASFHTQPLGLVLTALAALYPLWALYHLARGHDLHHALTARSPKPWFLGAGVLILASWIYRLAAL